MKRLIFANLCWIPGLFQYGGDGSCWISEVGLIGKTYSFAIPVLILVFVNICIFFKCFFFIFKSFRIASTVNPQRGNIHIVCVYSKLFAIMGTTWLIGFLPGLTGNQTFWYPFSILNSLQGFYVFLAFGLSPSARKQMAAKWMAHQQSSTQSTNVT